MPKGIDIVNATLDLSMVIPPPCSEDAPCRGCQDRGVVRVSPEIPEDIECQRHIFENDRCVVCNVSWVAHVTGFGIGGFTTKSRKGTSEGAKRLKGALSGE